ncbi:hypothetical protein [Saliphagus sp. LR7]|uniref:hypothetical protein n=1 Tax=Saliphagus sp. LR7 TaxID=2282654 RepID=UPI000DF7376D|nr:hypothetical protein [Saliphagus sp. LR7]
MSRTDPDLAEEAKERANDAHAGEFELISFLCPACNEPCFSEDPDPNDFVHDPDEGEFGNDRAAFQISPSRILDLEPDNPWDRICVYPTEVEYDDGPQLQVQYCRHDFSQEKYQAWKRELDELKDVQRRAEENQGLDSFTGGGGS